MKFLGRKTKSIMAFATSIYLSIGAKLAIAAGDAEEIFGSSIEKAEDVKNILLTQVCVTLAAIVWIIFFMGMIMGKTSKEWFGRITVGCIGLGAVGSIVDFLL